MKRKILAMLLVLVMLTSIMPLAVYAEDEIDGDCQHANYSYYQQLEGHRQVCRDCNQLFGSIEAHNFPEGSCFCIVCSFEYHSGFFDSNETGHRFACMNCDYTRNWENHIDNNSDGVCDLCNWCMHANTEWVGVELGHQKQCSNCDTFLGDVAEHVFSEGSCSCVICSVECHNGHTENSETSHRFICMDCGFIEDWENHYDSNNDSVCDYCLFDWGCQHTNTAWYHDQYGHYSYCLGCYKTLIDFSDHVMQAESCTICSYTPCTGEHTFGTEGYTKQSCQVCGYWIPCQDENADCICDICGEEVHQWDKLDYNENIHWANCTQCGALAVSYNHFDEDSDGICDACQYNMSGDSGTDGSGTGGSGTDSGTDTPSAGGSGTNGSGTGNSNLDKVPKTGDVSVAFLGIALLLFATAAALSVSKKRV